MPGSGRGTAVGASGALVGDHMDGGRLVGSLDIGPAFRPGTYGAGPKGPVNVSWEVPGNRGRPLGPSPRRRRRTSGSQMVNVEPGPARGHRDGAAVVLHDLADDGQSEAAAALGARRLLVAAPEALEHLGAVLVGDARALVGDRHPCGALVDARSPARSGCPRAPGARRWRAGWRRPGAVPAGRRATTPPLDTSVKRVMERVAAMALNSSTASSTSAPSATGATSRAGAPSRAYTSRSSTRRDMRVADAPTSSATRRSSLGSGSGSLNYLLTILSRLLVFKISIVTSISTLNATRFHRLFGIQMADCADTSANTICTIISP